MPGHTCHSRDGRRRGLPPTADGRGQGQWLATHFAGCGIRANAIAPGFLVSNQNRALLFNPDGSPTARSEKILKGTPMGRFVDSEELLGGVFFLTDDEAASAISGVVLPIDAGFAAYSGV